MTVEKWPPEQNLEGRTISLKPTWLPVRFDEVTGRIRFADGQLELTDLSATRDKSRIELAGPASSRRIIAGRSSGPS